MSQPSIDPSDPAATEPTPAPQPPSQAWIRWLAPFYGLLFCIILWSAYTGNLPAFLGKIPNYDIPGHIILYAMASYLGHRLSQWKMIRLFGRSLPLFPLGFTIWTIAEECLQSLSPNRTFSIVDLVCSLIGIILGWQLANRDRVSS